MDTVFMRSYMKATYEYPGIESILEEHNCEITQWKDYQKQLGEKILKKYKFDLPRELKDQWDEINGRLLYKYIEEAYLLGAQDRELMLK